MVESCILSGWMARYGAEKSFHLAVLALFVECSSSGTSSDRPQCWDLCGSEGVDKYVQTAMASTGSLSCTLHLICAI